MGTTSFKSKSKHKSKPTAFQHKYIKLLRKKKVQYLSRASEEQNTRAAMHRLSILSDVGILEVDWKIFVEDFLEEHQDTCFWASPLLDYFKKMAFKNEKRWIDQIFYLQFASVIAPPLENDITISNKALFKSMLEEKMLNASVIANESPSLRLTQKKKIEEAELKLLSENIDKALRDSKNPFKKIIVMFKKVFSKKYHTKKPRKVQRRFSEESLCSTTDFAEEPAYKLQEALVNIQYFIKLLIYSLSLFYKTVITSDKLFALREIIVDTLVDSIVCDDVYNCLYNMLHSKHYNEVEIISAKIKAHRKATPKAFGINDYLALTESVKLQESGNVMEEAKVTDLVSSSDTEAKQFEPYTEVIERFNDILVLKTPIKKLAAIADINGTICESVDNFWKGTNISSEKLNIDADQYLSILLYIIVKTGIGEIYVDVVLANELARLGFRVNYNRYCLTTLMAAFSHILSNEFGKENEKECENMKEKQKDAVDRLYSLSEEQH